jgi:hypothetical protein
MSEERRVIKYYRPRIQIPVDTMSTDPDRWCIYCLPVDGVQALQRIAPYLKREVTYIGEYITNKQFKGPTASEMQAIIDLVGQLEVALMSECGFEEITEAIERNTDAILALQCICTNLMRNGSSGVMGDNIEELIDGGEVIPSVEIPQVTYPPQAQADACAIAQLYYNWTWEVVTETVLPAMRGTFDHLVPVLAALVGSATGGIGFIPMYLIAEAIQELIEIGYNAAETNLVNWLFSVKEDWVCLAYNMLLDGSTDREIADAVKVEITDPSEDISFGDKVIVSFVGAAWSVQAAAKAWDNQTTWAIQNVTPGFCEDCEEPPDPQCIILDCDPGHWNTFGVPSRLGCDGGKPYCAGGYIRWLPSSLPVPAEEYTLEIEWTAKGDSGDAWYGVDLFYTSDGYQFNVPDSQPLAVGQSRIEKWHLYNYRPDGDSFEIQFVQANWFGVITRWCIRPGHV